MIFKNKEQLPLGKNSRGVLIPAEKGRRSIFVPSWGALEKEEIDDIILAVQEKEDIRIKKREKSQTREQLEQVVGQTLQTPRGKRAKTARQIIRGGGRWI